MSAISITMDEEIFKDVILMLRERKIVTDEDLICTEDVDINNEDEYEEIHFEFVANIFCVVLFLQSLSVELT